MGCYKSWKLKFLRVIIIDLENPINENETNISNFCGYSSYV